MFNICRFLHMMIIFYTPPPHESRIFEQFNNVLKEKFVLGGGFLFFGGIVQNLGGV